MDASDAPVAIPLSAGQQTQLARLRAHAAEIHQRYADEIQQLKTIERAVVEAVILATYPDASVFNCEIAETELRLTRKGPS